MFHPALRACATSIGTKASVLQSIPQTSFSQTHSADPISTAASLLRRFKSLLFDADQLSPINKANLECESIGEVWQYTCLWSHVPRTRYGTLVIAARTRTHE